MINTIYFALTFNNVNINNVNSVYIHITKI